MRLTSVLALPILLAISIAAAARQDRRDDGPIALAGPAPIEHTEVVPAAGGASVRLRLLLQPGHVDQADRYVSAVAAALAGYGRLLGPFPSTALTIVDPVIPPGSAAAAGPKSPPVHQGQTPIIVAPTHWYSPWTTADPEMDVVREIGRIYWRTWPSAGDTEARLHEALATFTAARVFAGAFPDRFVETRRYFRGLVTWPYSDAPWTKDVDGYQVVAALDATAGRAEIGAAHDVLALATLERLIGTETMDRLVRAYASRLASDPAASAADFETIAHEISGRDLTSFFDTVQPQDVAFDYAVDSAATGARSSSAAVRRLAAGMFPIDVRVTFADGSSHVEHWDGRDERRVFEYAAAAPIESVEIDPDHVLRLDVRRTNNSWSAHPHGARAARTWSWRWLAWFQHTLMDYAFFA